MPERPIGDIRYFDNGKIGRWDGTGWEDISPKQELNVTIQGDSSQGMSNGMNNQPYQPNQPPSAPSQPVSTDESHPGATALEFALPTAGAIIGGKVGGPIGSGLGAAAGTAYGDIYNMLMSATGHQGYGTVPTPTDEAKKLAEVAGLTAAGEKVLPPVLKGVGKIRELLPYHGGMIGGGGLGWLLGHPFLGAGVGGLMDAAPTVGKGIEWLGTPAGAKEAEEAARLMTEELPKNFVGTAGGQKLVKAAADQARETAAKGFMVPEDSALRPQNWGTIPGKVKSAAGNVHENLMALGRMLGVEEPEAVAPKVAAPPPPTSFRPTALTPDISPVSSPRVRVPSSPASFYKSPLDAVGDAYKASATEEGINPLAQRQLGTATQHEALKAGLPTRGGGTLDTLGKFLSSKISPQIASNITQPAASHVTEGPWVQEMLDLIEQMKKR